MPRNFAYQDGLKIIHRELELAFGDENGHLSIAVLEELIELEGIPPFPEAIFQRWKFAHRHRHVSLYMYNRNPAHRGASLVVREHNDCARHLAYTFLRSY